MIHSLFERVWLFCQMNYLVALILRFCTNILLYYFKLPLLNTFVIKILPCSHSTRCSWEVINFWIGYINSNTFLFQSKLGVNTILRWSWSLKGGVCPHLFIFSRRFTWFKRTYLLMLFVIEHCSAFLTIIKIYLASQVQRTLLFVLLLEEW